MLTIKKFTGIFLVGFFIIILGSLEAGKGLRGNTKAVPTVTGAALPTGSSGSLPSAERATETFSVTTSHLDATPVFARSVVAPFTPQNTPTSTISESYKPDQVLVRLAQSTGTAPLKNCLVGHDYQIVESIGNLDVYLLEIPAGEVDQTLGLLAPCQGVSYAEPNYYVSIADTIPNDPGYVNQYGLVAIRAPQGWDLSEGSSAVTIGIVDTGVDLVDAEFAGKLVAGYDFIHSTANPQDDNGHGTHVAGIAAANSNNGIGIAGVSWFAKVMPVKVLDASGNGTYANVSLGIIWAANHGAQVINLSLGGVNPSQTLQDAVEYAYSQGVTMVASAGNAGGNVIMYPARYPQVIAVGATDTLNAHAGFSNAGPEMALSAPGEMIYSTLPGSYGYRSGTSMAAAFVSGLAAILRGLPGNSSPAAIANQMEASALDLGAPGRDNQYGYGLIQMDGAIRLALPPAPTPSALPATGFASNRASSLPVQPAAEAYMDLGDMWLEIPRLGVEVSIVGVPQTPSGWDVSWLGDQAGWLNGTAYPTHSGNSAISAHVYDANGQPGPFVHLGQLQWGDQVIVHAFGQEYIYEVRDVRVVSPQAVSSTITHEQNPWLTLITCQGYDEASNSYRYRVVVKAVQVQIK
jgi:thermitase